MDKYIFVKCNKYIESKQVLYYNKNYDSNELLY